MMVGPGMWGGYGPGMMRGYGPGATGPGWNTAGRDLNLSTDNVKNYFARWPGWQGNPRSAAKSDPSYDIRSAYSDSHDA